MESSSSVGENYHLWYYNTEVWQRTTFLGVPCLKSVSDMWNYQEILSALKPRLVVEFGTFFGGSALFFAEILSYLSPGARVLTVDVDHTNVPQRLHADKRIEFLQADSSSAAVAERIRELRGQFAGNVFFILDSNHAKDHVLRELIQLRSLTIAGDYVVVEDGNINGHPVLSGWGEGPYEALEEYFSNYPHDYNRDIDRETKFGFTFAPRGFLIRH